MNVPIQIHTRSINQRSKTLPSWKIPREEKVALQRFLEDLSLGKVNRGRRISESRQVKYLDVLKVPLEFFGKPSIRLTVKDVESFEKALTSGKLITQRGKPYAHATIVDIRTTLRIYLRWRLGPKKAMDLTGWLDTHDLKKTPDFLKESEIEKLYNSCKSPEERFLIAVLFDTGARAGEFHNIRYEDVEVPNGQTNYVRLTLKEEYSKTKGRTISLYWKHSSEAVTEYLRQRTTEGISAKDAVFSRTYSAARLFLHRLGKRVLGRPLHFHLFRHSSATYYADKMNRQQLCIRYGWTFSSDMPDVYISRVGVDMKELDQKFTGTEVNELKHALARVQQENQIKSEQIQHLDATLKAIQREFSLISKVLSQNPSVQEIEAALRRRRAMP